MNDNKQNRNLSGKLKECATACRPISFLNLGECGSNVDRRSSSFPSDFY